MSSNSTMNENNLASLSSSKSGFPLIPAKTLEIYEFWFFTCLGIWKIQRFQQLKENTLFGPLGFKLCTLGGAVAN